MFSLCLLTSDCLLQSEIEKLKAENDRLKSENHGSCSRAQSQVSISSSPRHSVGLSQHSLNLTESTSLGEPDEKGAGAGFILLLQGLGWVAMEK